jgi:hypothetical protein
MSESTEHVWMAELVTRYLDGEIAATDEEKVIAHLAVCEICQRDLADAVVLDAIASRGAEVARGGEARGRAGGGEAAPARSRARVRAAIMGVAVAAAAVTVVVVSRPGRPRAPAIALSASRGREVRLGGAYAAYRPLAVMRGSASTEPALPLETLADLERRGDRSTLFAALVTSGDFDRARMLEHDVSPGEAAGFELVHGGARTALTISSLAPETDAIAHWNRALALRDLGYTAAAADQFAAVAALGEPGWADEAADRARHLHDEVQRHRDAAADVVKRGVAMIDPAAPLLTEDDVATFPALVRKTFNEVVRAAPGPEALDRLKPLAARIDATGGTMAQDALAYARACPEAVRAPLARRYAALLAGTAPAAEVAALHRDAAAAGDAARDIALGVALRLPPGPARMQAIRDATTGFTDPWHRLLVVHEEQALAQPNLAQAETTVRTALAECEPWQASQCSDLQRDLAFVLAQRGEAEEAIRAATSAATGYRRAGLLGREIPIRMFLGQLARLRAHTGESMASLDEARALRAMDVSALE